MINRKLTGKPEAFNTDVKRFGIPGYNLTWTCPKCDEHNTRELCDEYFSNPPINKAFDKELYCGSCEHEIVAMLKINLTLELLGGKDA